MNTTLKPGRLFGMGALILAGLACAGRTAETTPPLATDTLPPLEATVTSAPADTALPTETAVPASPSATAPPTTTAPPTSAVDIAATLPPVVAAQAGTVARDVTYCTSAEGIDLKMDVYFPSTLAAPTPAVVFIHGGGWSAGDKRGGAEFFTRLLDFDYVVISLNYRLAPAFPYPAQIQDVKCAIRYLRANAAAYGVDPARIGAMGTSAGAHLAAILGVTEAVAEWDTGPYLEQSSKVAAVVDFFGPADLTQPMPGLTSAIREEVFGATSPSDSVLAEASPVTYITPDDAPFLIIHGSLDDFVPVSQSEILLDRLLAAGVPAELVLVENGRHAFHTADYPVQPSREELTLMIAAFFDQYLK